MILYDKEYFHGLENADDTEIPRNMRNVLLIEKYAPVGSSRIALDVGVGTGLFIRLMKDRDWIMHGTDISEYALNNVQKQFGVPVFYGGLSSMNQLPIYDAINMRHSIEHMTDPLKELLCAFKLLKNNGVLCVSTPNSYGIHAYVYGKNWPHWSQPYHLNFYSKRSLIALVRQAGFTVLRYGTEELSIHDFLGYFLKIIGLPVGRRVFTNRISRLINDTLAKMGLGEGLILIAKK
jgi:SAM-dependent methyltransferase